MRFLDADGASNVRKLQLYLTPHEAKEIVQQLTSLLSDPEAENHFHVFSEDGGWEMSCSLVTERKLSDASKYTKRELAVLRGHRFR